MPAGEKIPNGARPGFLLKGVGGLYTVLFADGEEGLARPRGIFRKKKLRPLPGDHVQCVPSGDTDAPYSIIEVEERRNLFIRPPVANLDCLLLVMALAQPDPDWSWLDKMLIVAAVQGLEPILCFTKADLARELSSEEEAALAECRVYEQAGYRTLVIEPETREAACARLAEWVRGHTVALCGPSGVGKSTLLNAWLGERLMDTGSVSDKLGRGRHTTRHVEFFPWQGGLLADTPGFSSLLFEELGIEEEQVILGYPEFQEAAGHCRFAGCRHLQEPGCAVREAFGSNEESGRYARYCAFRLQVKELQSRRY